MPTIGLREKVVYPVEGTAGVELVGAPSSKKSKFRKPLTKSKSVADRKTNGKKGERVPPSAASAARSQESEGTRQDGPGSGISVPVIKTGKNNKQGDVAASHEVKAEKPERKRIHTFKRNWLIDEPLNKVLEKRFPNYTFETSNGVVTQHPHTLAAIERAITEQSMIDTMKRFGCAKITDIGGNAKRHYDEKRSFVHSCCPILSPKDVLRNQRYNKRMNYCTNCAEECNEPTDGYLAVHSLYYLKPITVLDLLYRSAKGILMASMHDFTNGYGSMHYNGTCHETTYQIVDTETVLMTSTGNDGGPYKHSPCFWLQKNYYEADGRAMAWGYREMGDTRIYTFVPAPCGLTPTRNESMDLIATIKNLSYTGEVKETAYAPLMNYLNMEMVEFKSFGPLIWVTKNDRQIFVPKGLIQRVAFQMVGKPRTRDTLKLCIRDAKKELSDKSITLPDNLKTELAVVVPPLAFLLHLEDEIQSFNKLLLPVNQKMYSKLNDALNLVSPAFTCFKYIACRTRAQHTESTLAVDEYNATRTSVAVVKEKIGHGFQFLSTTASNFVKPMRRGAYVKIIDEVEPAEDKMIMSQVSTTFSGHIPVVPTNTQSNTMLAIKNRVVVEVVPAVEGHWEKMNDRFMKKKFIDFDKFDMETDTLKAFTKWNDGFPPGRKKEHCNAFNHLQESSMKAKDYYRKLFMKREKLDKSEEEGLLDFNPRAISGTSHEANVLLGPFMVQYSKQLAKQWDGTGIFYYTSGATAQQTGSWMYDNFHAGDLIVEVDFSQYDSTQGAEAHKVERQDYIQAGIEDFPGALAVIDHQKHMRGFTNDGIEYFVQNGRNSGDPNTSCGNTRHTCATTEYVLTQVFGEGDYKIKGMGDDNTSIVPMALANGHDLDDIKSSIVEEYAKFGFVAKVKLHTDPSQAEFCSSAYWPAMVDGWETYVMGPKPGRLLPKMGFSIKNLSPGEVKGMFKGYATSCGHVPILNTYVQAMLNKMSKVKETFYVDKESKYKMLSVENVQQSSEVGEFFMSRYDLDLESTEASLLTLLADSDLDDMVEWPLLDQLRYVDV